MHWNGSNVMQNYTCIFQTDYVFPASVVFTEQIEGASLAWKDINMYVNVSSAKCCGKERKQLLSNVSGFIGKVNGNLPI